MASFDRAKLLRATENALAHEENQWRIQHANDAHRYVHNLTVWRDAHAETWRQFGLTIARRLRRHEPITRADLPSELRMLPVFGAKDPTDEQYRPSHSLAVLAEALRVLTDEKVSTATLRDLGVDATTLRQALQHLPTGSR